MNGNIVYEVAKLGPAHGSFLHLTERERETESCNHLKGMFMWREWINEAWCIKDTNTENKCDSSQTVDDRTGTVVMYRSSLSVYGCWRQCSSHTTRNRWPVHIISLTPTQFSTATLLQSVWWNYPKLQKHLSLSALNFNEVSFAELHQHNWFLSNFHHSSNND